MRAVKLAPEAAKTLVLLTCEREPALVATLKAPVEFKFPRRTSPLLEVMDVEPVTVKLPNAFCVKPVLTEKFPAVLALPPVCENWPRFSPPVSMFNMPAVCDKLPCPVRLLILTVPASAGATTVLPNEGVLLAGITTLATFDKSGTAPPLQLLGSNQLPVVAPVHVTLPKRLMVMFEVW